MRRPLLRKLASLFFLSLILITDLVLLNSERLTTYAVGIPSKSSSKPAVTSVSSRFTCGAWNLVASPNFGTGNNQLYGVSAIHTNNVWTVGYYTDNQGYIQTLIEHWDGTSWSIVSSPNPGPGGNVLTGVVAINARNVWAVGTFWDISGNNSQTLIEHWDGTSWSVIASPNPGSHINYLLGVTQIPGTNQLWTVGYTKNNQTDPIQTLIEHWDGTSWSVVASSNPGSQYDYLKGVTAISANNAWAVGYFDDGNGFYQTLIENWNGTSWNAVPGANIGPGNSAFQGVTQVRGSSKIWAVGYDATPVGPAQTLTEHWNGTNWRIVSSPNVGSNDNSLTGVVAISTRNIWAVGVYNDGNSSDQALIEHWDGTSWNVISNPDPASNGSALDAITRILGAGQLWAVGSLIEDNNLYQTLIEFYC